MSGGAPSGTGRSSRSATATRTTSLEEMLTVDADTLGDLTRAERIEALREAVLTLPVRYREAVVLCDLQEMSYADAAAALGCARGNRPLPPAPRAGAPGGEAHRQSASAAGDPSRDTQGTVSGDARATVRGDVGCQPGSG